MTFLPVTEKGTVNLQGQLESEVGGDLGAGTATLSFTFLKLPFPHMKTSRISSNAKDCCEV